MAEDMPDLALMTSAMESKVTQYQDVLAHLWRLNAGEVVLQSGRLVVCDPFGEFDESPFVEKMPVGSHPVTLCVAELPNRMRAVAYSTVHLSASEPATWEIAQVISSPLLGMPDYLLVESGTACYLDAEALPLLAAKFEPTNPADPFRLWLAQDLYGDRGYSDRGYMRVGATTIELSEQPRMNAVIFETGWGNDCYRSYLGRDLTGRVCCVLTDFGVIEATLSATAETQL